MKVVGVVVDPARSVTGARAVGPVDRHAVRISDTGRLALSQRGQRAVRLRSE